jgi:hypothetical protein
MNEVIRRKEPMNAAISQGDPMLFTKHYMGWLEVTAYVMAQRAGKVQPTADGSVPELPKRDWVLGGVQTIGNDSCFAFGISTAIRGDKESFDLMESTLLEQMGENFPGSFAIWHFRQECDAPETLDDHIGKIGKSLMNGETMEPKDTWNAGVRFLEKARTSNFVVELVPQIANWLRKRMLDITKNADNLKNPASNVPLVKAALKEERNDQSFIAELLLSAVDLVDMELTEDYHGLLKSVSRRL